MKNRIFLVFIIFFISVLSIYAQDAPSPKKIIFKYTFEGMKDSLEVTKLNNAVMQLKDVISSDVIFKSADHKYALLKVEILIPENLDENSKDVTGPSTLKKILSRLGYVPAECNSYNEN